MLVPTFLEPVNEIKPTSLFSTKKSPISLESPGIQFTTPFGSPASSNTSINLYEITGVFDDGFNNTVLPVTTGATVVPAIIAYAKFQGEITTETPIGK